MFCRRQIQDALNQQTYSQFKAYAEQQFPGNPEQVRKVIKLMIYLLRNIGSIRANCETPTENSQISTLFLNTWKS